MDTQIVPDDNIIKHIKFDTLKLDVTFQFMLMYMYNNLLLLLNSNTHIYFVKYRLNMSRYYVMKIGTLSKNIV